MKSENEMNNFDVSEVHQRENSMEMINFDNDESVATAEITEQSKASKNEQAVELMKSASELISEADNAIESAKESVYENVNRFEEAKGNLLDNTMKKTKSFLYKASYNYNSQEVDEPFELSLEQPHEKVKIKTIKTGRFSGFIVALLTILGVAIGWIYYASTKVGIILTPNFVNNIEEKNKIFKWIGGITGAEVEPLYGMIMVGLVSVVMGVLIYKLYISMRENRNFKVANEIFEKSNIYLENQKEAKMEVERIDRHIVETIPVIEDYRILLEEQNGKLQRILHIEGAKENNNEYHVSSIDTMRDSEKLMSKMEDLLLTPITKNGKLNEDSIFALSEAKSVYDYFVAEIYQF